MDQITLTKNDHGHSIRCRTYYSDIDQATNAVLHLKKVSDGTTTTLTSYSLVTSDIDERGQEAYSVDFAVADAWTDTRAGDWLAVLTLTFSNAELSSYPAALITIKTKATD